MQIAAAERELKKPFPQESELVQKSARLAELNVLLDMDSAAGKSQPADIRTFTEEEAYDFEP